MQQPLTFNLAPKLRIDIPSKANVAFDIKEISASQNTSKGDQTTGLPPSDTLRTEVRLELIALMPHCRLALSRQAMEAPFSILRQTLCTSIICPLSLFCIDRKRFAMHTCMSLYIASELMTNFKILVPGFNNGSLAFFRRGPRTQCRRAYKCKCVLSAPRKGSLVFDYHFNILHRIPIQQEQHRHQQ